jgi:SAM-dependent methyltransferase
MIDPHLKAAFGGAAPDHYRWQTESAFVSEEERRLVRAAFLPLGTRILDLGCAEGGTLKHLDDPPGVVGVDIFLDKLRFAREHVLGACFLVAAGEALPFASGSFDHVIVRDVVHHVADPALLFAECRRVLTPGGRLDVLEPNRYNPLILLHAVTTPAERGELRSTARWLASTIARDFEVKSVARHQPLPVHRLVFHPTLGSPAWAERALVRGVVEKVERAAAWFMPRPTWAYIHVRADGRYAR